MLKCRGVPVLLVRTLVLGNKANEKGKRYNLFIKNKLKYSQYL